MKTKIMRGRTRTMKNDAREMLLLKIREGFKITQSVKFVPWNISRNKNEKQPSLNWLVTLFRDGTAFMSDIEYSAGLAHCPSYKQGGFGKDHDVTKAVTEECLKGHKHRAAVKRIVPSILDVIHSLLMDGDVNGQSFEEWASNYGYDTDSRKAEQSYRACLAIESSWRKAFSAADLELLRELFQDY